MTDNQTTDSPNVATSRTHTVLTALCLLACCVSCARDRGVMPISPIGGPMSPQMQGMPPMPYPGMQPPMACAPGMAGASIPGDPMTAGQMPMMQGSPYAPAGATQPWPNDEYLSDGGDRPPSTVVRTNWEVDGLHVEDTIVHYDTLDGRIITEPSNQVHIYSPRFCSVRKVESLSLNDAWTTSVGMKRNEEVISANDIEIIANHLQRQQLNNFEKTQLANQFRMQEGEGTLSAKVGPNTFENLFKPFEDFSAIRLGQYREAETAFLADATKAAIAWTDNQSIQVVIDEETVAVEISDQHAVTIYQIEDPPGDPKMQIIKVASKQEAKPGETVEFTLRFDNTGNEVVGNVTLMDNLTTRLEYIEGTAQSSLPAEFKTEPNDVHSQVLRWEITEPIQPGQGGIIRFECRVR